MNSEIVNIDRASETYEKPTIEVVNMDSEGILCASTPSWENGGGAW